MHMQGTPQTMQADPRYDDVVVEVRDFLVERATAARAAGVDEVWIDPGIGFGKTADHNLSLLKHLGVLVETGFPVVIGTSRKKFLQRIIGAGSDDVLEGSVATAVAADGCGRCDGAGPRRAGDRAGGAGGGTVRGKWERGIEPRNFAWIIKDQLAVCERPGGYARNHRKVRRHEEILWLRNQGFSRIVSLLLLAPQPHGLRRARRDVVALPVRPDRRSPLDADRALHRAARVAHRRREAARAPGGARRPPHGRRRRLPAGHEDDRHRTRTP